MNCFDSESYLFSFLACSAIFACSSLCAVSMTTARIITAPRITFCQNSETPHMVIPSLITPITKAPMDDGAQNSPRASGHGRTSQNGCRNGVHFPAVTGCNKKFCCCNYVPLEKYPFCLRHIINILFEFSISQFIYTVILTILININMFYYAY